MKKTGPYKLLLADDSYAASRLIKDILIPENFDIKAVEDGEQAIEDLRSFLPDIVLADIDMPKLNGYQLCEMIKKSVDTKHIPVVLIGGIFEPIDEKYAKSIGADDFIVKPFESNELITMVKGLISNHSDELEPLNKTVENTKDISTETFPPSEEIKWDEEVPRADDAMNNQLVDEEFMSESISNTVIAEEIKGLINRDNLLKCIYSAVRDSVEQTIAANAKNIIEDVSKELISSLLISLRKEIDATINRIVSDVSERLIKKEIERIVSETK